LLSLTANGFSSLPNGMKVNWGIMLANSTSPNTVFGSAFGTACFGVFVTPAISGIYNGANVPYVTYPPGLANCQIRSAYAAAAGNVFWIAYGI